MSRIRSTGSSGHSVKRFGYDDYRLYWTVDRYCKGSRLRFPTQYSRDTDAAGAKRFIKKWGVTLRVPEELL